MEYDYDLFVIGAGSGGVRASRIAASLGARVAVAEEYRVGGTCVIRGCVPKKLMVYASHFSEDFESARGFGRTVGETSFDWKTLIARKDAEIDRLNGLYIKNLESTGVEIINGRGVIEGPNSVRVGDKVYSAKYILVAVGGWPTMRMCRALSMPSVQMKRSTLKTCLKKWLLLVAATLLLNLRAFSTGWARR